MQEETNLKEDNEQHQRSVDGPRSFQNIIRKILIHPVYYDSLLNMDDVMHLFNFNPLASKLITSYQRKICHYDKQQYERSTLEDHILSRTESFPGLQDQKFSSSTNTSHVRNGNVTNNQQTSNNPLATNDLIDLDLISGAAYTMKSKSQQGWISMLFHAILRVLFFPLYLKWWSEQTSANLVGLFFILYIMQIISIRLYYQKSFVSFSSPYSSSSYSSTTTNNTNSSNKSTSNEYLTEISATEVLMPIAMMIMLGIIHTQMVGTKSFKSSSSSLNSSSSSNLLHHHHHHSSKNSQHHCQTNFTNGHHSHHTDCSSSSSSSSTNSSVDSSPVADVRSRLQNRVARFKKFNNNKKDHQDDQQGPTFHKPSIIQKPTPIHVPKIKFYSEYESQNVMLIDDHPDPEMDKLFDNKNNGINHHHYAKRRTDSFPHLTSASTSKLKRKSRLHRKSSSTTWNYDHDDNLNSSPISLRSSLYGSSFDSEGTISPMTPSLFRNEEWPTVHSDGTSDGDDDHKTPNYYNFEDINSNQISVIKNDEEKLSSSFSKDRETVPNQQQQSNQQYDDNGTDQVSNAEQNTPSNELKVSCSIWQHNICQKIDLSVADISSAIIRKVETVEHSTEYVYLGIIFSITVALIPSIFRLQFSTKESPSIANILSPLNSSLTNNFSLSSSTTLTSPDIAHLTDLYGLFNFLLEEAFFWNKGSKIRFLVITAMLERFILSLFYFFLLCVTERTFKQRFLYSKYFSHITRRDRAKRSQVPHFRLHKVRNLKVWLSVRSYLRRYGPHRSVDTICSTTFIISICLLTCICLQILKESNESCTTRLICWEMIFWSLAFGLYIMRLMILGSRINQKYRSNLSVLITEQINLYLQLERKPHKKDSLMLANQVLKLAVDLLKELESPYKISGFSANPYLYNITKVVVLSAFSAVLTEMLGFKLKLYKIKLIR